MLPKVLLWIVLCLPLHAHCATLLIFGDSLSASYGLAPAQGWVALLQRELAPTHTVINASRSGETTAGGLMRLPAVLAQHKPKLVVLALGANDGLRGLSLEMMRANLAQMITQSQKAGAKVMLVGMALPPNYGASYTKAFGDVYRQLAKQYRLAWIPLLVAGFEKDLSQFQADGIHPNATAQRQMMENVKAKLPLG